MSIDHVSFLIDHTKFEDEVKFLTAAFSHIGFKEVMRPCSLIVGMGAGQPNYWLSGQNDDASPYSEESQGQGRRHKQHVAIGVKSREEVDQFYKAAIEAGGKDNGKPGVRPNYHPNYYGAFVITPAGLNLEAVYHGPSS